MKKKGHLQVCEKRYDKGEREGWRYQKEKRWVYPPFTKKNESEEKKQS